MSNPEPDYLQDHLNKKYQGCQSLDDIASSFDEAILDRPDYQEKFEAAWDAFNAWADGGDEIPDDLLPFLTWKARRYRLGIIYGDIPDPNQWLTDADEFIATDLPARTPYLVDTRTGGAVLLQASINQLFAFRGIGKSVVVNALLKPLLTGQDWLHFRSPGGLKIVLVDGELPKSQLQERLLEFSGKAYGGRLKIISPELMKNEKAFPVLSVPEQQEKFLAQIQDFGTPTIGQTLTTSSDGCDSLAIASCLSTTPARTTPSGAELMVMITSTWRSS